MLISRNWLQTFFKEPLPNDEILAELFTFHVFEVEGMEKIEKGVFGKPDTIFDLKVLPDRAHYALSYKGVALETALMTGFKCQMYPVEPVAGEQIPLSIKIETDLCRRYTGRVIENIEVVDSPAWQREMLEAVGQRSINSIVDATNVVMLNIGQPLHAFDKAKVKGGIVVRMARDGETMTTLDNKEVALDPSIMIIADDEGPLAIAGVKGGKRAEVVRDTKALIIESANFDPVSVRRTSTKIGIRNESSKRFENNLSPEVAAEGMDNITAVIQKLCPQAKIGEIVDIYTQKPKQVSLAVKPEAINEKLGVEITESKLIEILEAMEITVEKKGNGLHLAMPLYRQDLNLFEDIVEEVGRTYGYDKITPEMPPPSAPVSISKQFYYSEKIKSLLCSQGFSEVYLYSFVPKGEIEVAKPLASDKKALRMNLINGMEEALVRNIRNADLLELDQIKIFEIGTVFLDKKERIVLCLGIAQIKKMKGQKAIDALISAQKSITGENSSMIVAKKIPSLPDAHVWEIMLDEIIEKLPEPTVFDLSFGKLPNLSYKPFSVYPFITRDVAAFVPEPTSEQEIHDLIQNEAGELLVRLRLFDTFTKTFPDGTKKTSYAYRLVFQAKDRTLTDAEINPIMDLIYEALKNKGFEIR